jgi:hypothetical protein
LDSKSVATERGQLGRTARKDTEHSARRLHPNNGSGLTPVRSWWAIDQNRTSFEKPVALRCSQGEGILSLIQTLILFQTAPKQTLKLQFDPAVFFQTSNRENGNLENRSVPSSSIQISVHARP